MAKIKFDESFKKELLEKIPSNIYAGKALGIHPNSVSTVKTSLNIKERSGSYIFSKKNSKLFYPKIQELCLKYNQPCYLSHLDTYEKLERLRNPLSFNLPDEKLRYSPEQKKELLNLKALGHEERMLEIKRLAVAWGKTENAVRQHYSVLVGQGKKIKAPTQTKAPASIKTEEGYWMNINGKKTFIPKGAELKLKDGKIILVFEKEL